MSGRIPKSFINDLLTRVDIVDLVDTHVPLKKTGSNFVARCPFHAEKTPSFSVNRAKQMYRCFGCGASGNAITFLMEFNHLDFVEAVEDLAAFAGVPVQREPFQQGEAALQSVPNDKRDLQSVYATLQQVAEFYAKQLQVSVAAKQAVAYLKARGVGSDFARHFMLGFAPEAWRMLENYFPKAALLEAGLLIEKEDGQCYDRFRGRLMFPIRDKRGRVVGFGARVLDDSLPKYLNSPETAVFQKSKEVYGLYELLAKLARPARILVVEGYMDVIALVQAGIGYAVATLGTATSKAHLDLLFRYTAEIVLCFDGDDAGRKAAWRAMDVVFESLKEGRQVRVMLLPQGVDPDSLVKEEGEACFSMRIAAAQTLSEYFFEQLSSSTSLSDIEGRAKLVGDAKPYLDKLPEGVFREMMFEKLKQLAGVMVQNKAPLLAPPSKAPVSMKSADKGRMTAARTVIALLLQNPRLSVFIEQREIEWQDLDFQGLALLQKIVHVIMTATSAVSTAVILEAFRDTQDYKSIIALAALPVIAPKEGIDQEFCDGLDVLLKQAREKRVAYLLEKSKSVPLSVSELESLKKSMLK